MARRAARSLTYRDFYDAVADELPALLPPALRDYRIARTGGVLKVHYGDPRRHYELWFRGGGLEVALHLEGRPEDYEPALRLLESGLAGVTRSLGGEMRLEPFGPSWMHLFEWWSGQARTAELASDAAARLTELVRLLEPKFRRAGLE